MPVDASYRIQSNSALVTATSSFTASLPGPTQDESTLLLYVGTSGSGSITLAANTSFDPPWYQDQAHGSAWYAWRRPSQPAGETSWTLASSPLSNPYYWRVEEWSGLSTIGQPDASGGVNAGASVLAIATDSGSGGTTTADVADFAALAVFRAGFAGASGWPAAHSYGAGASAGPSSWNEVAYLANGTGTGSGDFILAIAEAYPGATGNVGCTLTFDTTGGGGTPGSLDGWAVCYQPGGTQPPSLILVAQ